MNEKDVTELVSQAVANVLRKQQDFLAPSPIPAKGRSVLVLIPGMIPFAQQAASQLRKQYAERAVAIAFAEGCHLEGIPTLEASTLAKGEALCMAEEAQNVVLLAPTLKILSDLATGRDESLPEYLFLHAALWGKNVALWMDFDAPQGQFSGCADTLKALGTNWFCYRDKTETQPTGGLITEEDVLLSARAGRTQICLGQGMLVTPLAKDAARRLGVIWKEPEVKGCRFAG